MGECLEKNNCTEIWLSQTIYSHSNTKWFVCFQSFDNDKLPNISTKCFKLKLEK